MGQVLVPLQRFDRRTRRKLKKKPRDKRGFFEFIAIASENLCRRVPVEEIGRQTHTLEKLNLRAVCAVAVAARDESLVLCYERRSAEWALEEVSHMKSFPHGPSC